tara:strand:+ start:675 stop:779 length:105 start_codon:yes stop_codon:yes gene_type:complete
VRQDFDYDRINEEKEDFMALDKRKNLTAKMRLAS